MAIRKTPPKRLTSVALAKSRRAASGRGISIIIEDTPETGGPNTAAAQRKPRLPKSYITSEGHTRRIYGPALEGKRHLTDEDIAAIVKNISSK